ncbi:MAG: RNA polymerase sigma factor [Armatimonas sp.]
MQSFSLRLGNGLRPKKALSESALLTRARQGDREAFDALICLHEQALRYFLLRQQVGELLEDVLQETLLAAWVALPGFEPRVRFKTWLYRIARNKAIDAHRRAPNSVSLEELSVPGSDQWATIERALWVRELLDELPEVQRQILELYYFEELTLEETALVLDRNVNTVKYHFYQAHTRALHALEKEGRPL